MFRDEIKLWHAHAASAGPSFIDAMEGFRVFREISTNFKLQSGSEKSSGES
jgi:hypothetical protein